MIFIYNDDKEKQKYEPYVTSSCSNFISLEDLHNLILEHYKAGNFTFEDTVEHKRKVYDHMCTKFKLVPFDGFNGRDSAFKLNSEFMWLYLLNGNNKLGLGILIQYA
jgi:hypothetical protein